MAGLRVLSNSSPLSAIPFPSVCPRLIARYGYGLCHIKLDCKPSRGLSFLAEFCRNPSPYSSGRQWKWSGEEVHQRRPFRMWSSRTTAWDEEQSPYETLGVERDADEEGIKVAYRQMAKQFHPDVYDNTRGELNEGETAESRFIRIQAAYELLMDHDLRRQYDSDHRSNPLKASKAWMEWVIKKKKAFEQRGDMAVTVWAEQQQRDMNLKARRLSRHKVDPEEERRILAREKAASVENFETTIKRHTLVLKKRDLLRKKADDEAKKKLVQQLLAAEGFELDDDRF